MGFEMDKEELKSLLREVVTEAVEAHPLSDDEIQWVRMAIKAEADRASLRKAIIEKTLAGLFWLGLVSVGGWAVDYVASHWKA